MATTPLAAVAGRDEETKPTTKEAADPYAQRLNISERMEKYMQRFRQQREAFEREWYLSINYYLGNQWILWDSNQQQHRKKKIPYPGFPQPVTNIFAQKIDDNIASLAQEPPVLSWVPATDDVGDIKCAEIADRIDATISDETGRKRTARLKATWAVLTGCCFVESYYDNGEEHGKAFLQHEECRDCGYVAGPKEFREADDYCPQCGGISIDPAFQVIGFRCDKCANEFDDQGLAFQPCPMCMAAAQEAEMLMAAGQQMGAPLPEQQEQPDLEPGIIRPIHNEEPVGVETLRGKMCERVRSPFEVYFDHMSVTDFNGDGLRQVIVKEMMDRDEAEDMYRGMVPDAMGSYSGNPAGSTGQLYLDGLATISSTVSGGNSTGGAGASPNQDRIMRETLYELPCRQYPQGLFAVRLGGQGGRVVEAGPMPYSDTDGKPFIPLVQIGFKPQPGRAWPKTIATDMIPLQTQRNQTECMMMLCERRMANPIWKWPKGAGDRMPTGEPGEIVQYHAMNLGGGRPLEPTREAGVDPGMYWRYRLESLDQQMERVSGSFAIARGDTPPGVTAASALGLLAEKQSRHVSPQVTSWELAHERIARQQMFIFRAFAIDQRVRVRKGDNSRWQVDKWSSADLTGKIDVSVEFGSATPKSRAQQRAQIEALVKMMVLDPMNPEVNRAILERFGESEMSQHLNVDIFDAQTEGEKFMLWAHRKPDGEPPSIRVLFDNHMLHLAEHIKLAKTDKYRELEQRAKRGDDWALQAISVWEQHVSETSQVILEQQAAQQMAEQGGENPEEEKGGEPGQEGPGRPKGTGNDLSRGGRAPSEEATRAVMEPRAQ